MRYNNHDDLPQLSFTLKISIYQYFQRSIYNPVEHFIAKIVSR